jgi:hypothetical protein
MDALEIFKQSWRITFRHWRLWLITFLMLLTFTPSMVISFSFSTLVQSIHLPAEFSVPLIQINPLFSAPEGLLTFLAFLGLAFMVISLAFSWILQAAAIRVTSSAVEGDKLGLRQAFSLGWDRFINIVKLSLVFGLVIAGIAYTPVILFFIAPPGTPAELFMRLITPILGPINISLNFIILLLIMAVALDKSSAQDSIGRAWEVFKSGWVRFVVVIFGTSMITILTTLLLIPLMLVLVILFMMEAAPLIIGGTGLIIGCLTLGLLIFQGVFSLVLYTVTYRASSNGGSPGLKAAEVYGF